jgi:hypothetical protein
MLRNVKRLRKPEGVRRLRRQTLKHKAGILDGKTL